jgi:hypothetical protein
MNPAFPVPDSEFCAQPVSAAPTPRSAFKWFRLNRFPHSALRVPHSALGYHSIGIEIDKDYFQLAEGAILRLAALCPQFNGQQIEVNHTGSPSGNGQTGERLRHEEHLPSIRRQTSIRRVHKVHSNPG